MESNEESSHEKEEEPPPMEMEGLPSIEHLRPT